MSEVIGQIFLVVGLCFTFFGCVGLVRMPDVYCRLQAATKCVTLGTGSVLIGALIITGFTGIGIKSLVCFIFLFLNSPTAAHALAKSAKAAGVPVWKKTEPDKNKNL
ncbi:monovalent cation/H(+) antiporter subunit G [bacterium]|nr:monovalent cation/H(+) antiporter subunit G [bacterium]